MYVSFHALGLNPLKHYIHAITHFLLLLLATLPMNIVHVPISLTLPYFYDMVNVDIACLAQLQQCWLAVGWTKA